MKTHKNSVFHKKKIKTNYLLENQRISREKTIETIENIFDIGYNICMYIASFCLDSKTYFVIYYREK